MQFLTKLEKLKLYSLAVQNMTYLAGNKALSPPIILWLLSKRCNLACKHCDYYLSRDKINGEGLMRLAEKMAASDTMVVDLSGGEPFIIPNIREIITVLKDSGKKIMINTNGFNLDAYADFLIEQGVESITVSVDGVDAKTHDTIRGKEGSFDRAVENLEYLKRHRKNGLPYTSVRGVIMKDNLTMMKDYIDRFDEVVDEIKFQPIHDEYDGFSGVVDKEVLFTEHDKQLEADFRAVLDSVTKDYPDFDNAYYKNFPRFIFHPEQMEERALHHCLPVWMNFMIVMDDGSCRTCTKVIGNLHEKDLESIWTGEGRLGFLRSISRFGKCKIPCWLNCTGVAQEWQGKMLKSMLSAGPVSDEAYEDFKRSPNYKGVSKESTGTP